MTVCLAAGKGERLKPLTNYLHKAMIPFSGVPFLAYSLEAFPAGTEIVVVVNHLRDQIEKYFGSNYRGRCIRYFEQKNPRGTGDALAQVYYKFHPTAPVLIWQADQLFFQEDVDAISSAEANAVLHCSRDGSIIERGLWKLTPETMRKSNRFAVGGELRALPVVEAQGYKITLSSKPRLEISHEQLDRIEVECKRLKLLYTL